MARLDDVVGAILRDLTLAQDVASKHSKMLAVEYADDPLLSYFPVPRTELRDVELELKFIPKQVKTVAGSPERTMAAAAGAFENYAPRAARALLQLASEKLDTARALPGFPQSMLQEISDNLVSPAFSDYVTKEIKLDLASHRTVLVTPPDTMDYGKVRDTTIDTAARVIFDHPDLKKFFDANPKFASDLVASAQTVLKDPLDMLQNDFAGAKLDATEYELDVVLDPLEMTDTPSQAFSTIRIRADLRNYRWVSSPGSPDQLVEET